MKIPLLSFGDIILLKEKGGMRGSQVGSPEIPKWQEDINCKINCKWQVLLSPPSSLLMKPVLPKTNPMFILFSNLGLIMAQQTSNRVNCFMTGDDTPCPILPQKMHVVGEVPGEIPSALRCLSYLISNLLANIKHLAEN